MSKIQSRSDAIVVPCLDRPNGHATVVGLAVTGGMGNVSLEQSVTAVDNVTYHGNSASQP